MTRSVEEWVGATPDVAIPKRVKLRVFERHNGICHISGRKITAADVWDCDHIVALCNGGGHRESNLAPALRDKHRAKTAEDVADQVQDGPRPRQASRDQAQRPAYARQPRQ
jgi:5-methylcytosine-specific restriction protein A